MQEKLYFSFFIFCVIFSQGILAKLLEEDVEESSKLLVRQKRVIDRRPGGEIPLTNGDAPYVVNLKKDRHLHCIATILSRNTIITAARCVLQELRIYIVQSGSAYSHRGNEHNVTDIKTHQTDNPSSTFTTGIALLTVNPPFAFGSTTRSIGLHSEPVLEGMEGTVYGWGTHINTRLVETAYPKRLRAIHVPILNHRACVQIYRNHFRISDEEICTYHSDKLCGATDVGAPLIMDNKLVGVHTGRIFTFNRELPIRPDVFVLLQHATYRSWIMSNIEH